jgi:hypothetical protein
MTVGTAASDHPVQAELPIPMGEIPTDEEAFSCASETSASDADILRGLGALADLVANASETLNQCLLTIENKLGAASIAREEWVPIQAARSAIECVPSLDDRKRTQERVFGGVTVMILQMSAPTAPPQSATKRCEWQYELGYAVAGDDWALVIRTSSFDAANDSGDGLPQFSDVVPLRDAPLEIRLKAVRELPSLLEALDAGTLDVAMPVEMGSEALDDTSPVAEAEAEPTPDAH